MTDGILTRVATQQAKDSGAFVTDVWTGRCALVDTVVLLLLALCILGGRKGGEEVVNHCLIYIQHHHLLLTNLH